MQVHTPRDEELTPLRDRLAGVPAVDVPVEPAAQGAMAASVRYLGSDAALRSLERDTYWPKWDSPWWHMVLLFELGEARRIPERVVRALVDGLDALPIKIFPIEPGDLPPGIDPRRQTSCHCALGCIYQVLAACGLDVDRALPWAEPWFMRYQMADGGLTCESSGYLVKDECPSSMVGTVPPLEAMLLGEPAAWSAGRAAFVDRAAGFLVARELRKGSATAANAEERAREPGWLQPCFPRLYLYDVLRGASVLVRWAERRGASLSRAAIEPVAGHLAAAFPDGVVRLRRRAFEGIGSWGPDASGAWTRQPASRFPLLEVTSVVGAPSPWLTRQWTATRRGLLRLIEAGRIEA